MTNNACTCLLLFKNMHFVDDFAQLLLRVGEGTEGGPDGDVRLPEQMVAPTGSLEGLISHVYPTLAGGGQVGDFKSNAILASRGFSP